jgi:hypothetical protein
MKKINYFKSQIFEFSSHEVFFKLNKTFNFLKFFLIEKKNTLHFPKGHQKILETRIDFTTFLSVKLLKANKGRSF